MLQVPGHDGLSRVSGPVPAGPAGVQPLAESHGLVEPRPLQVEHEQDLLAARGAVAPLSQKLDQGPLLSRHQGQLEDAVQFAEFFRLGEKPRQELVGGGDERDFGLAAPLVLEGLVDFAVGQQHGAVQLDVERVFLRGFPDLKQRN